MMEAPFEDQSYDYTGQPLPSLSSTLLQNKNQDNLNVHSIQVMLGLQQQHDMFASMGSPLDYKGTNQKLENSPMHQDLGIFQQGMEAVNNNSNGVKRKNDEVVLLQSQNISSEIPTTTTTTQKKNDKKKNDNNGVKKKKTRQVPAIINKNHTKTPK